MIDSDKDLNYSSESIQDKSDIIEDSDPTNNHSIQSLGLSRRSENILLNININTLGDFRMLDTAILNSLPNCGEKSLYEIKEAYAVCKNLKEVEIDSPSVKSLNLSRRSENVLMQNNIKTLDDFFKYDITRIRFLPNCGRKSANEITEAYFKHGGENANLSENISLDLLGNLDTSLMNYSISYLGLSPKITNIFISNNIKTLKDFSNLSMIKLNKIWPDSMRTRTFNKLIKEVDIFINNKSTHDYIKENFLEGTESIAAIFDMLFATTYLKNKEWLIQRIFHGFTLEECGKIMGVTRERIRQIESKFFKQVDFELAFNESNNIKNYLIDNNVIKNVFELEAADPLFKNISKYLMPSSNPSIFFNNFFKNNNIARWEKIEFEYRVFPIQSMSSSEIIDSYNINSESHFNLSLRDSVKADCILAERLDVFEYVYQRIRDKFNSTSSMARYAIARLRYENKGHPIKVESILDFIKKEFNFDPWQEKRAIAALFQGRDPLNEKTHIEGLYPYEKNSFIFLEDIINEGNAKKITLKVIGILLEVPGRQFNLKNILKRLMNEMEFKSFLDKEDIYLTHPLLNIIMRAYAFDINSKVIDHGRLLWSINLSDTPSAKSEKRIEKYPLIIKILKENGSPMRLVDIQNEVSKTRGSAFFQIHTTQSTPKVIQLEKGIYGLRDRDINISMDQEKRLISKITESFDSGKKILDFYDILDFKKFLKIDASVKCFQIAKMLYAHIPVGRRRTPDKVIFLQKTKQDPNRFAIYSMDVSDTEVDEYLKALCLDKIPDNEYPNSLSTYSNYWSLKEACKFFLDNGIENQSQYMKWRQYKGEDKKLYLPQHLEKLYKDSWLGWDRLEEML